MRKKVSNKATGAMYLLLAFLVIAVGIIAHLAQTTIFDVSSNEAIFQQLDMLFMEYVMIGFFTGIFLVLGIYYLRTKDVRAAPEPK